MAAVGQLRPAPPSAPNPPAAANVRTPIFLVGVALALIAFVAMLTFGIVLARGSSAGKDVPVVIASQDIGAREPILPDMVQVSSIPQTALPPHAIVRVSDLAGSAALVPIYKGEAITDNIVSSSPDQLSLITSAFLPIPAGYVAITIPTSELQGVGGYPAQGDYINIVATVNTQVFQPGDPHPRLVTETVFTSVKIIRVGPLTEAPKEGQAQGVVGSLTVLMSLCDAQYMAWFKQNATLAYVLLSYKDYQPSVPAANPECPATVAPGVVGPKAVDARWKFTQG